MKLAPLPPVKESVKFGDVKDVDLNRRTPIAVSLGCHMQNYAYPHPDPCDPYTTAAGVCKRAALEPPKADMKLLLELKSFVLKFCQQNFKPLAPDTDLSIETWLETTDYPLWRRSEILKCWMDVGDIRENMKYRICKCFVKDEHYLEYKHSRGIYARRDEYKAYFGPYFKAIEQVIYAHPAFIKHVPVADRPKYIMKMLFREGVKYYETDYTAFESLFTRDLMECCEFVMYEYMTQYLPSGSLFMSQVREVLGGVNELQFKHFWVNIQATRMSGEMCTSLGNGFSNLMFMLFVCSKLGSKCEGVVEGDDGLFAISGPAPSEKDFEKLGLRIKLVEHNKISTAAFCQIIFDDEDQVNVVNPIKVLLKFGWGKSQYVRGSDRKKLALLRCKSLSLAVQYRGCPIVQSLAQYGLRMTLGITNYEMIHIINSKAFSSYERSEIMQAIFNPMFQPIEIGVRTRLLVEQQFNISVEVQKYYEDYLDRLVELQPLQPLALESQMTEVCRDYSFRYFRASPISMLDYPPFWIRSKYVVDEVWERMHSHTN